jgi:hypothetical protein
MYCAQFTFSVRNRRLLPEFICRLFGPDNAVENKAFEEIVRQARKPKTDTPKAQLMQALRSLAFLRALPMASLDVSVDVVRRRSPGSIDQPVLVGL